MVAHHLAKVRVASSNLVIRSNEVESAVRRGSSLFTQFFSLHPRGGLAERRGSGLQSRIHGFESRIHLNFVAGVEPSDEAWAIGAAVARFPDTEEVTGSIPVSPTIGSREIGGFFV